MYSVAVTIMLSGDVMTGRGIDQILDHPCEPRLHESFGKDTRRYVQLEEAENGEIDKPVPGDYIWGNALAELDRFWPDIRITDLETSSTADGAPWPGKGIHYRMHPRNIGCLTAAEVDVCALANNHMLDWGSGGLSETVEVLGNAGVNLIPGFSGSVVERILSDVRVTRKPGDIVVRSVRWGGNWGYSADIDIIQGHSSHHFLPFEVYKGRMMLYGCGDLINDYEGIGGHEEYKSELSLIYIVNLRGSDDSLAELTMLPFRMKLFSLREASPADIEWIAQTLNGLRFGTTIEIDGDGNLHAKLE